MSYKCPKGHAQGFDTIPLPGGSKFQIICRQCRREAIFRGPSCICGCKEFTLRPIIKGNCSLKNAAATIQCNSCGRYVTTLSPLIALLPQFIGFFIGGILGFLTVWLIQNYVLPIFHLVRDEINISSIVPGVIIGILSAILIPKLIRNIFIRKFH